ncbi:hypothetical protein DSAG12_02249 [Promethearchaeum syntrophicum]|uniref:Uncharacterized protein n=1 Tax=Promethearchaeum syntrophicum TaxID=2594042 RepID=A0A5B9DAZ4_9ARCH|nr:thrombospondin type 3 repeat-containing protein [Candidatus Prometheoarchaeum syntrophicum]QEE16419.1 hypothetical protein DSAG12_02249 [Candidatus Prometheoarchaeum syntrophicum]
MKTKQLKNFGIAVIMIAVVLGSLPTQVLAGVPGDPDDDIPYVYSPSITARPANVIYQRADQGQTLYWKAYVAGSNSLTSSKLQRDTTGGSSYSNYLSRGNWADGVNIGYSVSTPNMVPGAPIWTYNYRFYAYNSYKYAYDYVTVKYYLPYSDTDGDGLTDGEEINTYNTNPQDADSDNDGYNDHFEAFLQSDPNDANSLPRLNAPSITNRPANTIYCENGHSKSLTWKAIVSGPNDYTSSYLDVYDSSEGDWDRISQKGVWQDSSSISYGITPPSISTSSSPVKFQYRLRVWSTSKSATDYIDVFVYNYNVDTDGDGLTDGEEINSGNDGYITKYNNPDSDYDTYPDNIEIEFGSNPISSSSTPNIQTPLFFDRPSDVFYYDLASASSFQLDWVMQILSGTNDYTSSQLQRYYWNGAEFVFDIEFIGGGWPDVEPTISFDIVKPSIPSDSVTQCYKYNMTAWNYDQSNSDEFLVYYYNYNVDSDGDGLNDFSEINTFGTDPLNKDSDDDLVNDLHELAYGSDPLDSNNNLTRFLPTEPSQSYYTPDDPSIQGKIFTEPIVFNEEATSWWNDDMLGGFQVGFSDADFSEDGKILHETGNLFVDLEVEINPDKDLDTYDKQSYNVIDSLTLYMSVLKNDDEFLSFEQICQTLSGNPNPKFSIENDEPTLLERISFTLLLGSLNLLFGKAFPKWSWIELGLDCVAEAVPDGESDILSFNDLGSCSSITYDFSDTTNLGERRDIYGIKMCVDLLHQFNSLTSIAQNGDVFNYFMRMEVGMKNYEKENVPTAFWEKNGPLRYNYYDNFQFIYEN